MFSTAKVVADWPKTMLMIRIYNKLNFYKYRLHWHAVCGGFKVGGARGKTEKGPF